MHLHGACFLSWRGARASVNAGRLPLHRPPCSPPATPPSHLPPCLPRRQHVHLVSAEGGRDSARRAREQQRQQQRQQQPAASGASRCHAANRRLSRRSAPCPQQRPPRGPGQPAARQHPQHHFFRRERWWVRGAARQGRSAGSGGRRQGRRGAAGISCRLASAPLPHPPRPRLAGTWLMHCHIGDHIAGAPAPRQPALAGRRRCLPLQAAAARPPPPLSPARLPAPAGMKAVYTVERGSGKPEHTGVAAMPAGGATRCAAGAAVGLRAAVGLSWACCGPAKPPADAGSLAPRALAMQGVLGVGGRRRLDLQRGQQPLRQHGTPPCSRRAWGGGSVRQGPQSS